MEAQEDRKRKILEHETRDRKLNIEGFSQEEILNRINEIDLEDILLTEKEKSDYLKDFKPTRTNRKDLIKKYQGVADRERVALEAEEKRIMDEKRKYKQKKQVEMTEGKK